MPLQLYLFSRYFGRLIGIFRHSNQIRSPRSLESDANPRLRFTECPKRSSHRNVARSNQRHSYLFVALHSFIWCPPSRHLYKRSQI